MQTEFILALKIYVFFVVIQFEENNSDEHTHTRRERGTHTTIQCCVHCKSASGIYGEVIRCELQSMQLTTRARERMAEKKGIIYVWQREEKK